MIVSDLESLLARLLMGGIISRCDRMTLEQHAAANDFLEQCWSPGITEAAGMEVAEALHPLASRRR